MLPLYPSHQFWRPRDTHHSWIGLRYSAEMLLVFLMKPPNSSPVPNSCLPTIQMPKGHSEILFQKQCSQSQRLETLILFSSSSHMSSETWISKGKSLTTFFFLCPFWAICDKRALFVALAACGSLPVAPASEPC